MKKDYSASLDAAAFRLREIRDSSGLNQKQFAESFEVNPTTYNRYESGGIGKMPNNLVQSICERYNINPSWLMGFDTDKFMLFDKAFEKYKRIPMYNLITADVSVHAQSSLIGYEYVPENSEVSYCLQHNDDSMIGARIFSNDIVYVNEHAEVTDGDIAVVITDNNNATLRRVFKKNDTLILHAENPMYTDQVFTNKELKQIKLLGVVTMIKITLKK